jgi:hypothetical protein
MDSLTDPRCHRLKDGYLVLWDTLGWGECADTDDDWG